MTIQFFEGMHKNISNEEYHIDPATSRSGIMIFKDSPYKYWSRYINENRPALKTSDAMWLGSMFHMFILEPNLFWKEYIVDDIEKEPLPEKVLLKNVGRPKYEAYKAEKAKIEFINSQREEEFLSKAEGKFVCSPDDYAKIYAMREALMSNRQAWELIEAAVYESSYFWQDKESGLMVKARPDILHENIIVDLKTCRSAASRAYQRSMIDGGYHIQGAMVRDGVREVENKNICNAINICIETDYPHAIGIKIISERALDVGEGEYKDALKDMKICFESGIWPSYQVENVELPDWY